LNLPAISYHDGTAVGGCSLTIHVGGIFAASGTIIMSNAPP
jgi:hypothetical protein